MAIRRGTVLFLAFGSLLVVIGLTICRNFRPLDTGSREGDLVSNEIADFGPLSFSESDSKIPGRADYVESRIRQDRLAAVAKVLVYQRETGRGVAGVRVLVEEAASGACHESYTGEDGRVDVRVSAGTPFCVKATRFQVEVEEHPLRPGQKKEVELEVTGEVLGVTGTVIDAKTLLPISGVSLRIDFSLQRESSPRKCLDVACDDSGRFGYAIPHVSHVVTAAASSYSPIDTFVEVDQRMRRELVLQLLPLGELMVHVRDVQGMPLVGIDLVVENSQEEGHARCKTDNFGDCDLDGLPTDTSLFLSLYEDGSPIVGSWPSVVIEPGGREEVLVEVGSCLVEGRVVTQDARAVEGSVVYLQKAIESAWSESESNPESIVEEFVFEQTSGASDYAVDFTDDEGRFSFSRLASGRWIIGVSASNASLLERYLPSRVDIVIVENQLREYVELELIEGQFIEGKVVREDGKPLCGATVSSHDGNVLSLTLNDGTFVHGPVGPGPCDLSASIEDVSSLTVPGGYGAGFEAASSGMLDVCKSELRGVYPGSTSVILVLGGKGGIEGVVMKEGQPCEGRIDLLKVADGREAPPAWSLHTCPMGRYSVLGLASGLYTVAARTDDDCVGITQGIIVEVGHVVNMEIDVIPGCSVSVAAGNFGNLLVRFSGSIIGVHFLDPGENEFVLPAGEISLEFVEMLSESDAESTIADVFLSPGGGVTRIDFSLR